MLTREQMEQIIKDGASVLYQGQVISRVEALPSAAHLAKGDPAKEEEAARSLQQQINQLQSQLAELQGKGGAIFTTVDPTINMVVGDSSDADPNAVADAVIESFKPKKTAPKKDKGAEPSEDQEGEAA